MFTAPQSDPVTFWQPSFSRPNVVIVASPASPVSAMLGALWVDAAFEVVQVATAQDALTLVERGRIAVVALVEPLEGEGWTQLVTASLARPVTPRLVLLSRKVPFESYAGWLKMKFRADSDTLKSAVAETVAECQRGPDRAVVRPSDILAAVGAFPEAAWLRFTSDSATGDICFRDGVAVYAESGRKTGSLAVTEILSWTECECEHREFPSVLPSNLNQPLADLVRGGFATPMPAPAPPAPAPAAVTEAFELEEPVEFPDFTGSFGEEFDAGGAAYDDLAIEEPTEMLLASEGFEPADEAFVIPELPEIPAEDPPAPPAPALAEDVGAPDSLDLFETYTAPVPPASPDLRSTIFTCVAVMEDGVVEMCEPPSGFQDFDASSLCHTFNGMARIVESRSMGVMNSILLRATQSSLVLAQCPGSKRLLVAKFAGSKFGAAEEMELNRLLENAVLICPTTAA